MGKNKVKMWVDEEEDILYISFKKGVSIDSEEVREGIRLEYNKNGELIGLEINEITKRLAKQIIKRLEGIKV